MSIKVSMSSDGSEVFTAPTLKELCLYKCLTNKKILTTEVKVDKATKRREKIDWEKFRLKEPIQRDLVEALLDAGSELLFMPTPTYEAVLAAIRMSQPENLVKVHVRHTDTLQDRQLELLLSGGNVKSLDIYGCKSLWYGSLDAINKFGSKLEYLRIGKIDALLPGMHESLPILRTPNLKTFIFGEMYFQSQETTEYWRWLMHDFISNLEDLQICGVEFDTLEFLEPAKTKLTSLTLSDCWVTDADGWASLFKLNKLRILDLVGSSIWSGGADVVGRLLTAMPNLTRLAVDPGLVKRISADSSIRGQGSVAKRLEFLGSMDNDATELRQAHLLANDVAYYGTIEGEIRVLEYFSTRLNPGDIFIKHGFCQTLTRLLKNFSEVGGMPPCKSMAVLNLVLETIKNNGIFDSKLFPILKHLFTPDVAAKLGDVLIRRCIDVFFFDVTSSWRSCYEHLGIISGLIDIMMNLDGLLDFENYSTLVETVMEKAEVAMSRSVLFEVGVEGLNKDLLKKMAQFLEKAVDRFPEKTDELWGISSVLGVLRRFKEVMHSKYPSGYSFESNMDLLEMFSSMIESVKKLCLNSSPCRAAFHCANGVRIVLELLSDIIDGYLAGLADSDCVALLEILKSVLQDTVLDMSESGMIASGLEKLLLPVHSQWEVRRLPNWAKGNEYYFKMQSIINLLNYLDSDPRFDYKASGAVNEIMMKLR